MARLILADANATPPDHTAGTAQIYYKQNEVWLKEFGTNERLLGGKGMVKQVKHVSLCTDADYTYPTDEEILLATLDFTPSSTSSKIEVRFSVNLSIEDGKWAGVKLFRNGFLIGIPPQVGTYEPLHAVAYGVGPRNLNQISLTHIDEPNSVIPVQYGIVIKADGDYSVNKVISNPTNGPRTVGTLTIIEYDGSPISISNCTTSISTGLTPTGAANCPLASDFTPAQHTYWIKNYGYDVDYNVSYSGNLTTFGAGTRIELVASMGNAGVGYDNTTHSSAPTLVKDYGSPLAASTLPWMTPHEVRLIHDGSGCWVNSSDQAEHFVRVTCANEDPQGNWVPYSQTTSSVVSNTMDHANNGSTVCGGGGGGGTTYNIFNLTDCDTAASVVATDPSGFAPSVGDVVAVTPSGGSVICATVTSSGTSATDPASTITANFTSCGDCNATNFCHAPSDLSMTLSGGSYSGTGYNNTVQVAASGSLSAVNIQTKLTLETKLGGRSASDVLLSSYGQVTGLSISSGSISFTYDGAGCFNSATENLEYRLKVECGDKSSGSWVTHSTSHSSWGSTSVDHSAASEQCSTGTLFQVTDCFDSSTHLVEDSSGIGVSSGDLVDFYDSSSTHRCGTITATNQGGSANGAYINWHQYSSCQNCANNNSITNPQLYTVTDCNNPSNTYVVDDTGSSLFPSTGDVVDVYLNVGDYICATVTGTTTGTAVGIIQSNYTNCSGCLSSYGLEQHLVTDCNSSATHIVTDSSGMVYSVGDVISYYDKATYSTVYCGTVTTMNVTGTALHEISSGYDNCTNCTSSEGL